MRFYSSDTCASCWYNPFLYKTDEDFFSLYLRRGDVVIDVGANVGVLTLKAASIVGKNGKVFSIEAHPRTCEYLKGNVGLNKFTNVEVFNVALGDNPGLIQISDRRTTDVWNRIVDRDGIPIPVETLDGLLYPCAENVALLKIDVEGYEKFVLAGARQILQKTTCIYFESDQGHFTDYGYSTADIFNLLIEAAFGVFKIEGDKICRVPLSYVSETTENLLAIRDLPEFIRRTNLTVADNSAR